MVAPFHPEFGAARGGRRIALFCVALVMALTLCCGSADAVVTTVGSTSVGLQPREETFYWEGEAKWNGLGKLEAASNAAAGSFDNDPNSPGHPGPVMHSVATYAIYWDPQDYYHGDWQELIDNFLANAGVASGQLSNVFAVDAQYTDTTGKPASDRSSFRGAYTDTNPYPASEGCSDPHPWTQGVPLLEGLPVCLTDAQLRAQLETFIAEHSLQKGMGTIFYLLTPPGVTVCLDGGGPTGHCSDFAGSTTEIAAYEEARATYPERLARYEQEQEAYPNEVVAYEEALVKYEREKKEKEEKKEPFETKPPTEPRVPVEPVAPVEPSAYAAYKSSFCSYHSDINPNNAEIGDAATVLYAVLPWTAGGAGDYHFASEDQTQGVACQDGGFSPGTKPLGELQEKEREKALSGAEEEAFEKMTKQEQREAEEAREAGLEKPHEQEPNQLGSARGPDSFWDHGLADLVINQLAIEQQNTVTDPLLDGWQDSAGSEVTDECRNSFFTTSGSPAANPETRAGSLSNQALGEGSYYLNDAYNLAYRRLPYPGTPCLKEVALEPKFTAPNPIGAGEVAGFDGMESYITLDADPTFTATGAEQPNYAVYTWNFGDGSPAVTGYAPGAATLNSASSPCNQPWLSPCAASAFHSYQYGGTYKVTLTVTDVGGNSASLTKAITVIGPPPPSGSASSGSAGSGPSSGGSAGASGVSAGAPTLATSVLSRSLSKAIRLGLALHYAVNQQVAGRAEALLDAATAARLHIKAPLATGLPKGYPRELIVGSAVLVTTRAGQGTVRIIFSKPVAKRLGKVRQLKLTLRFVLRSATPAGVRTTTTMSTVILSH